MSTETDRFDALLMNVAQTQRGIEPLLDTVFSFLRRKTDFFTGASAETIESTVLQSVRKQAQLADEAKQRKRREDEQRRKKELAAAEQKRQAAEKEAAAAAAAVVPRFEEVTEDDGVTEVTTAPAPAPVPPVAAATDAKESGDDDEEDSGPPPVGNGGTTATYSWTQTLQEAQASFPVPAGTKSRQVDVVITATKLRVGLKGSAPLADGALFKKVKVDDSFWTLEDGNRVCVYLQKENQMEWWKTIVQGDAEIDTKRVQPENSKLGDLDADTRQTVEKMMFDQRQKALGLPSSDDLQKQSVLQKFMAQHPEMDFSNAKIN